MYTTQKQTNLCQIYFEMPWLLQLGLSALGAQIIIQSTALVWILETAASVGQCKQHLQEAEKTAPIQQ